MHEKKRSLTVNPPLRNQRADDDGRSPPQVAMSPWFQICSRTVEGGTAARFQRYPALEDLHYARGLARRDFLTLRLLPERLGRHNRYGNGVPPSESRDCHTSSLVVPQEEQYLRIDQTTICGGCIPREGVGNIASRLDGCNQN